ncbi:Hemolymph lipopolysaccharide-binding protein [Gryllus bimaculatus]|nr:Hemolymph lipopolysaccharide-binding protein [Gryllus bimaculatus]
MQLETHLTVAPPPARPGYELNAALGSRYKLHLRPQTWVEALGSCEAEGAHLAVVNGEAEAAMLRALFARHPVINDTTWAGAAWVGFHDRHTEGEYLTVLGGRVDESGYNKWIASQPDNKDYKMPPDVDSDCGGIHRNALLDDLPCSARYVFICEQELW